jgi:hypothetical protein
MKPYSPGLPLVAEFERLIDSLPGRIKLAKTNTREVCKVAGIPRPTYYKQLKARSFNAGEIKALLRAIAKLNRRFKVAVEPEELELVTPDQDPIEVFSSWSDNIVLTPEERELLFELQLQRDEENRGKPLTVDPAIEFRELVTQIVAQRAYKGESL